MTLRDFNTAHRRALKAEREMTSNCEAMAVFLQQFFSEEITVLWQPSDGFVVLHSTTNEQNLNTPVDEVIDLVKKDVNAFK